MTQRCMLFLMRWSHAIEFSHSRDKTIISTLSDLYILAKGSNRPLTFYRFSSKSKIILHGPCCRSQHVVSVESLSLFHHSIYLWFICFPWWSIDVLENLHADRTAVCFKPWQKPRARLGSLKSGFNPQYFLLTVPRRCFCCDSYLFVIIFIMFACYMTFGSL